MERPEAQEFHEAQVQVPALDGYRLGARHLTPASGPARAAVVVAPAMGVHQRFYARFARHLAAQGFAVLTFDYRGIGDSAPPRLRGFPASIHTWGEQDLGGVLAWLRAAHPGAPLLMVGHSVAGQLLGFAPGADGLAGVLLVGSQSGYWGLWPSRLGRAAMWLFWHAVVPPLSALLGRLPMRAFGQGEDLPGGVAAQWARWGRHPLYLGQLVQERGLTGHARLPAPMRFVAVADDSYAPPPTVEALMRHYPAARAELRVVHPHEAGARAVGHFGFFQGRFRDSLWAEAVAWLDAHARPKAR